MNFLYEIDAAVLAVVFFVLLVLAVEAGRKAGRRVEALVWERVSGPFGTFAGTVLGLLGLLLAFSFGMASARYDSRKVVLLKEVNAIGTAWLRADFLEPAAQQQMKTLMRAYVDQRVAGDNARHDPAAEARAFEQAAALQLQMWKLAAANDAYLEPKAIRLSMLASALNDMIDVSADRKEARQNRVPELVLWMLLVTAALSGALGGYAFGAAGHRSLLATLGFAVMVSMVVFTILDLDRPRRGLIQVDYSGMTELRQSLR